MHPQIESFISCKRIAVVGFSRSGKKFGNIAGKELIKRGYEIYPVHPNAVEIEGITCYPDFKSLDGKAEALLISIPSAKVPPVLEEAAQTGLKNIWLQQGSWSKEVQQTVDRLGLPVVSKKCILMYAPPVTSVHKFHRTIVSIFGRL
ncbi:MAG TPA: CoA-binding protein [Prolixibacteraceae bacterium]|nr:CoA-binding protein [Prolixibacteraceae bacterium]